jgi:hypothetical protein
VTQWKTLAVFLREHTQRACLLSRRSRVRPPPEVKLFTGFTGGRPLPYCAAAPGPRAARRRRRPLSLPAPSSRVGVACPSHGGSKVCSAGNPSRPAGVTCTYSCCRRCCCRCCLLPAPPLLLRSCCCGASALACIRGDGPGGGGLGCPPCAPDSEPRSACDRDRPSPLAPAARRCRRDCQRRPSRRRGAAASASPPGGNAMSWCSLPLEVTVAGLPGPRRGAPSRT